MFEVCRELCLLFVGDVCGIICVVLYDMWWLLCGV